jgi:two-component system osmolarity sensor histidine kinase EnvZ
LKIPVKPKAFKRAVTNLVSNACRYADNVTLKARRKEGYLRITIEDDGPGIPAEARDDVFRPFFRLDDARNQDIGGTGLGLAIARDIVQSHGGDIELGTSQMGGLKVELRVPV